MSKRTDVTYGRQGGRLVPTDDGRSHLEHLNDLRESMGGSLRQQQADVVEDGQLDLFALCDTENRGPVPPGACLVSTIPIMRVPISLPCQARVTPGTPDTSAPIEERTEWCAVDAFWMIGKAMICDLHLHECCPAEHDDLLAEMERDGWAPERLDWRAVPWEQRSRYPQEMAAGR